MTAEDPLVLLGGMNCSPALWSAVRAAWGDGSEPEIHLPELDADSVDACVDALLDQLPARFALAGLSLGGIVAMRLIRRAPDRVRRLCLLATNARGPTDSQCAGWRVAIDRLEAGASARDLQRDLLPVLLGAPARSESLDEMVLRMGDACGVARLTAQLRTQLTRTDERAGLLDVAVPTTVVAGTLDALCPPRRHLEITDLIRGARLVELDGVGHLSPLEAPHRVADALRCWLA